MVSFYVCKVLFFTFKLMHVHARSYCVRSFLLKFCWPFW